MCIIFIGYSVLKVFMMLGKCPECGGQIIEDIRTHELVCSCCGLVVEEKRFLLEKHDIDEGKKFFDEGRKTRIDIGDVKFRTYKLNENEYRKFWKLRVIDDYLFSGPRNIIRGIYNLLTLAEQLGIESRIVQSRAKEIFVHLAKRLPARYGFYTIAAVSLYLAIKEKGIPLQLKKILHVTGLDGKTFFRVLRYAKREIKIKSPPREEEIFNIILIYGKKFGLRGEVLKRCKELCKVIRKNGKNPYGLAAAIIYYVLGEECGYKITQKKIAEVLGVCECTLRSGLKILKMQLNSSRESIRLVPQQPLQISSSFQ